MILAPAGDWGPSGAGDALARLSGVLWDARVGRFRAPGCCLPTLLGELRRLRVQVSGELAEPLRPLGGRWRADFGLRDYQQGALTAWLGARRRGVMALPTGAGKTRTACAAMAAVGARTIVLVPTRVLLHQWVREVQRWYDGRVVWWGDGEQQLGPITVATYASMQRHMPRIGHRFGLLVVDEVHHFGAEAWAEILDLCAAPARLGLTATLPESSDRLMTIGQRIGPVVFERSLLELSGTALAPFRRAVIPCPLEPEVAAAYAADREVFRRAFLAFLRVRPGGAWSQFVGACQYTDSGRAALDAWERCRRRVMFPPAKRRWLARLLERHRLDRSLIFAPSNETVYRIARSHLIGAVTCDVRRAERADLMEHFCRGRVRALVSAQVLNEGVDVPDADVAIIVGGRAGTREHVQRVGRVLRPRPGKLATVYELVVPETAEVAQSIRRSSGLEGGKRRRDGRI